MDLKKLANGRYGTPEYYADRIINKSDESVSDLLAGTEIYEDLDLESDELDSDW